MKFLVDESINSESRAVNFLDVGIHDNVELTEVKVDSSPKGNEFLAFTFTSQDGKKLTKTEWKPNAQSDDVLIKKCKNQAKRVKHIMSRYMMEDQTKIEYDHDNWTKYASTVKAKLDIVKAGVMVRVKGVYDDNNFVTLPNYVPFIERMDSGKNELEILTIDKITKDSPDTEVTVDNSLSPLGVPDLNIDDVLNTALDSAGIPSLM